MRAERPYQKEKRKEKSAETHFMESRVAHAGVWEISVITVMEPWVWGIINTKRRKSFKNSKMIVLGKSCGKKNVRTAGIHMII